MNAPLTKDVLGLSHGLGEAHWNPAHSIGQLLVEAGDIDAAAAEVIAKAQQQMGLSFGEVAIHLKIATARQVHAAVARQFAFSRLENPTEAVSPEAVTAFDPSTRFAEQMRSLRTRLVLDSRAHPEIPRSVGIFSASAKEGRSFLAVNLAVVYAQMGARVLLIDADLRNPSLHTAFSVPRLGLTNVILGRTGLETCHEVQHLPGLFVLSAGTAAPNPQELLLSTRFAALMQEVAERFDVVIVDSPPAARYADAQVIASRVGFGVIVARARHCDPRALARCVPLLAQCGAKLVGSIFNEG